MENLSLTPEQKAALEGLIEDLGLELIRIESDPDAVRRTYP